MMMNNKRRRSRVDAAMDVVVCCGGLDKYSVRTRNLSLKGMLCDQEPKIKSSRHDCQLIFTLSGDVSFRIAAKILRNDASGLALDFEGMDESAFFHLRNLVRFQSHDPDAIDKELAKPAFRTP
jgi:hypothetical protein